MKTIERKYLLLLAAGSLLNGMTLVLSHFMKVSDAMDGFIKGVGIGIMLLAIYKIARQKRQHTPAA